MKYTKECDCIVCGQSGPSIVDHALGSTFKHSKVLVGHWFVIPLCPVCDSFKSVPNGSTQRFIIELGFRLCDLWIRHKTNFEDSTGHKVSVSAELAIIDWGR